MEARVAGLLLAIVLDFLPYCGSVILRIVEPAKLEHVSIVKPYLCLFWFGFDGVLKCQDEGKFVVIVPLLGLETIQKAIHINYVQKRIRKNDHNLSTKFFSR